nr:serine/threonine-protein kinase STY46 [Ipomoea batatas]
MVMEDNGSCGSRVVESTPANTWQQRRKVEVYTEVLRRLKDSSNQEVQLHGFDDQLWAHFNRLPTRYALDVNVERAEDVLTHKRLLHLARDPLNRPVFEVRVVQVNILKDILAFSFVLKSLCPFHYLSVHPPPAFGSSPNLEALVLEASKPHAPDENNAVNHSEKFPRYLILRFIVSVLVSSIRVITPRVKSLCCCCCCRGNALCT